MKFERITGRDNMRKQIFIIFALLFFVSPTLALNQNFSLDNSLSSWGIVSGTWDTSSGYLVPSSSGGEINHTIGSNQNYIEIEFKPVGAYDNYFYWSGTNRGFHISSTNNVQPIGFSMTAFSLTTANYTTIKINIANSQINITAFYEDGKPVPGASQITTYNGTSDLFTFIDGSGTGNIYLRRIFTSGVSPSSSNSITWGSDTYYSGDYGNYVYTIVDANWNCATCSLYQIRANVYKGDTEMESIALSSQTGTVYYQFGSSGTDFGGYTVKLISYFDGYYSLGFSGTELASGNTSLRSIGDSRIMIPSTIPTGVYTNASVVFGFTPSNTFVDGIVLFSIDENGNEIKESTSSIYTHLPITVGTPFNISVIPRKEGKYILKLYDFAKGYVASAATTSNFQIPVPTLNITTSFIKTDLSSYAFGEVLTANYGIDNSNFSNYKVVLDLYNYDYGISTLFQPLVHQSTDFYGTVFAFSSNPGVCDFSTKECQVFGLAGNNTLRLLATNATASVIITNANFTISSTNAEGYGLKPSKTEVCTNEKVFFLASSPLPSNFTITNTKGTAIYSLLINQTKTISYIFKDAGEYSVNLFKTSSTENVAFIYMKVKSCGTPTPTGTTTTAAQTTALVDLLSSNLFWALIFTVGMMTMIAFATMKREKEK